MPRLSRKPPKYARHKASGQAVVTLDGRDHYMGRYGSAESKAKYRRLIREWRQARESETAATRAADRGPDLTVAELIVAYLRFAEDHYKGTDEVYGVKAAVRPLRALFGRVRAVDFGPLKLKAVRDRLIGDGKARSYVNDNIGRIKRVFAWGVENEIIPPATWHALQAVRGLRRGKSAARETEPVRPVADADVDAILPRVSPQVRAMIELQRLTGARPAEVCIMRTCDIDVSRSPWLYVPERHKTEHFGKQRRIFLGPRAQRIVEPFLKADTTAFLFSPAAGAEDRREVRHARRKTPAGQGNERGTNVKRRPGRKPGDHYTVDSYRRAIVRACLDAGIPQWTPNRLRHTAATRLERDFDIETARVVLGHSSPDTTRIYAERDFGRAAAAMANVG